MADLGPTIDELVIIATQRSGTNYFCECITGFREIKGFYELFNPAGVFGVGPKMLRSLNPALGLTASKATDLELRRAFREQPLAALEALARAVEARGATMMSYKIFPGQLPSAAMEALLAGDRRHPVFIVRGRLDVYISLVKARQVNAWTNTNTEKVRPEIDVRSFLEWADRTDEWYGACLAIAKEHQKKYVVLRYETDIDVVKAEVMARIQRALLLLGLSVNRPDRVRPGRFKRQDRRAAPFEKIANGSELEAALHAAGRYDYAMEAPLDHEISDLSTRRPATPFARLRRPWRTVFRTKESQGE